MNPIEPETSVSDWLGTSDSHSARPHEDGDGWWALPSATRPRIYVSANPTAWKQSLGLVNSPRKRLLSRALLSGKSLLRAPVQWRETGPSPLREWLTELFPSQSRFHFAIYIGTPSIFVTDTIQCMGENGETLAFLKVPRGPSAASVVRHEAEILDQLAHRFPGERFYPALLGQRNGQFLQAPPHPALASQSSNPAIILARLKDGWSESFTWADSPAHKAVIDSLPAIRSSDPTEWPDILLAASNRLGHHFGNQPVPHPMSHGDFIRWNILPGPFAFDWEWAAPRLPWHDAFHYLWMPHIQRGNAVDFRRLWTTWQGPEGSALRSGGSTCEMGILPAIGYLMCQLSFYTSAVADYSKPFGSFPILVTLKSLLGQALEY